jgi:DHA1 family tetracycline resistance protein-like MFS transporter
VKSFLSSAIVSVHYFLLYAMKRSPLVVIFLTIFIDLIGVGILIPIVPQLLANPHSPEYLLPAGMSMQQGYILLGILTASYTAMQFLAAPILGQLSDRFGRRPILIASITGTALGYVLFAIAIITHNIPLLFASRMLDGITGGNISVAQAAIADISTPENRSKNFGLIGAAFGLGFIIGPYLGGQLADTSHGAWFNAATPFWFAALLATINIISIMLLLPETNTRKNTKDVDWTKSFHDILKALRIGRLRWLFIVNFLYIGGFTFFTTMFGVFLVSRYGFGSGSIGNFFAYVGIWIVLTQAFVTRLVAKKWSEWAVVNISLIGTGVAMMFFLVPGPWMVLLAVVPFFSLFNGLTQANYIALISRSAPDTVQGEVLGINASVTALAQSIPPVIAGYIASVLHPSATVVVASVVVVLSGFIFLMTVRKNPIAARAS